MNYSMNRSVPFYIPEISHGFQEAKGLFKTDEKGVELEFEVTDSILGFFKSGVQTVHIPFSELQTVRYKKGWFRSKIILEAFSMKTLEDIPGSEQASCTLKIKRKHRKDAEQIVSQASLRLSEYKLSRLDETD